MSGGSKQGDQAQTQAIQQSNQISSANQALSQQYADLATAQLKRSTSLEQPLVQRNNQILSGNMPAIISAMGPALSSIEQQSRQATANTYNSVPQGAGRDVALAQAQIGKGQQIAGTVGNAYNQALQSNAALGGEALGAGLQQEGATLSANQGALSGASLASQTGSNLVQQGNQQKASTLGFLGQLAGAAGTGVSGHFPSDVRLKENIYPVGDVGGVPIYTYNYKGDPTERVGPMAQEVYFKYPDAVIVGDEDKPWMLNKKILADRIMKNLKVSYAS